MTIKTNRGGVRSAALYSVVQTTLENNLKVYDSLVYLFQKMPSENFVLNPETIDKYVPWSKELPTGRFAFYCGAWDLTITEQM